MKNAFQYNLIIVAVAILMFVPFLGAVHLFDWDEINFAECAREMLVTHNYFSVKINFQPFWEKPPIFIWMQALSMNIFGINEFAARLPDAVCGIITLPVLFNIGRKLYDERFGLLWSLVYAGSFLPHFYFKSGIIDPWFNLFIFSGVYYFIVFCNSNKNRILVYSALFIGLAVLTKGPAALLIFGLCAGVYWISKRFQKIMSIRQVLIYASTVLAIGGIWFLLLLATGNGHIIKEFFLYQVRLFNTQDAGHGGPFYYHFIVLLIGCFPLSVFALRSFKKSSHDTPYQKYFKLWMMILFWTVLILFSIVKTKIVHYSSLCYFPLSYLGAYAAYKLMNGELKWKRLTGFLLVFISGIIGIAIAALPLVDRYKDRIIRSNVIKDRFAVENLKAEVHWTGFEWLLGLLLVAGTLIMLFLIKNNKMRWGITGMFLVSLAVVNLSSVLIAPRIEQYSQGAAIEFYESLRDKDCYIATIEFKSYAQLFYTAKREQANPNSYNDDWLFHGRLDKPAYFVSKITAEEDVKKYYPDLKRIYQKNGFVFWARFPGQ